MAYFVNDKMIIHQSIPCYSEHVKYFYSVYIQIQSDLNQPPFSYRRQGAGFNQTDSNQEINITKNTYA